MPSLKKTPNIGLNQWEGNEYPKRTDFNEDNLKTDQAIQAIHAEKGQPNGIATLGADGKVPSAQLPVIEVPVTSVNQKTGAVVLTASDVGAETPTGVQLKIEQALNGEKGSANGIATLDSTGNVPASQLGNVAGMEVHGDEYHTVNYAKQSSIDKVSANMIDMAVELETLKASTLNGVDANIFIETFQAIGDINLLSGVYDQAKKRIYIP